MNEGMYTPPITKPVRVEDMYVDMITHLVRIDRSDGPSVHGMLESVHEDYIRVFVDPDGAATEVRIPRSVITLLVGDWD